MLTKRETTRPWRASGSFHGCGVERLVRMGVAPVPVFGLFAAVGLGKLVFLAMIFVEEAMPRFILVIVPLVIVLVVAIVDAAIVAVLVLRSGRGENHRGRGECAGKKYGCQIAMQFCHAECLHRIELQGCG